MLDPRKLRKPPGTEWEDFRHRVVVGTLIGVLLLAIPYVVRIIA